MEIVWLKRDIRIIDHGPIAQVAKSNRPLLFIYNYEPDQLSEHSVHGSHVAFVNEGLIDLDKQLGLYAGTTNDNDDDSSCTVAKAAEDHRNQSNGTSRTKYKYKYKFQVLTVCHAGILFTLNSILQQTRQNGGIHRILTHEETGHLKSFSRDKAVRRWCKTHSIILWECNQTGVTRCLKSRDDFSKMFTAFLQEPLWDTPTKAQLEKMRQRLVRKLKLYGLCESPLDPQQNEILQIPFEHRNDRADRQRGGETEGLAILESFLLRRGRHYSSGISSPNTSWTTGGRISPYVTWGNLGTRYIIHVLKQRQEELRQKKKANTIGAMDGPFLKSLAAFSSRMHWRSHFIQKLESEPQMETNDLCSAYQYLRTQPGDWNEEYYVAWSKGMTGFPFVDACMRCLIRHGWLNFRMRAMLVSFATYNLWLDWKRIAPHLARVFLDYEPGIHYPQLQMQAGTTGINAMRVYNVTKQGKDQDPDGIFIKKYVPELRSVPLEYIHEPSKMNRSVQAQSRVLIGSDEEHIQSCDGQLKMPFQPKIASKRDSVEFKSYPNPIADEKKSATKAKEIVSSVRNQNSTKRQAEEVYLKHGSRSSRNSNMDGIKPKALSSTVKRVKIDDQRNIRTMLIQSNLTNAGNMDKKKINTGMTTVSKNKDGQDRIDPFNAFSKHPSSEQEEAKQLVHTKECMHEPLKKNGNDWTCGACTYLNDKPLAPTCFVCGTKR
jgi:deoxyribodipyrimidine photo-lyase